VVQTIIDAHAFWMHDLSCSASLVATASEEIKLWQSLPSTASTSGPLLQCVHTLSNHTRAVRAVCLSPSSQRLLSGGSDNTLIIWDVAASGGPKETDRFEADDRIMAIATENEHGNNNSNMNDNNNARFAAVIGRQCIIFDPRQPLHDTTGHVVLDHGTAHHVVWSSSSSSTRRATPSSSSLYDHTIAISNDNGVAFHDERRIDTPLMTLIHAHCLSSVIHGHKLITGGRTMNVWSFDQCIRASTSAMSSTTTGVVSVVTSTADTGSGMSIKPDIELPYRPWRMVSDWDRLIWTDMGNDIRLIDFTSPTSSSPTTTATPTSPSSWSWSQSSLMATTSYVRGVSKH
jgi:WD40 repeat protein